VCGCVIAGIAATATSAAAAVSPALVTVTMAAAPANETAAQDAISVSGDGRLVAFVSGSSALVPGDSNGTRDVFVRDTESGVTTRVSLGANGEANGASSNARISADGRFVVFTSQAANLVDGDTNGVSDVFLRDLAAGTTTRLSVSAAGVQGNAASGEAPSGISADGGAVSFSSSASNLVDGDTNRVRDVFVWSRAGGVERVSVASDGAQAAAGSSDASALSADGRRVAFTSTAPNLVAGDGNLAADVFVHDRSTGSTVRASVTPAGAESPSASSLQPGGLSGNGRVVAFDTGAALVPGDTGGTDVYVRDLASETTERVSLSSGGTGANGNSSVASVSDNGRYVAFQSSATNLDPGDTGGDQDIFVRDRAAGITRLASTSSQATQASQSASISGDGRYVGLTTTAGDIVPGDAARGFGQGWDVIRFGSPFDVPVDVSPPQVQCTQDDGSWHAGNVTLQCSASDPDSGLADAGQAAFALSTDIADGSETADASTGSAHVCDVAGNCTDVGPFTGIRVDRKAPAITISLPADGAAVDAGSPLNAAYGCADGGSGVATCTGPVSNGAAVDTGTPGAFTFTVSAADAAGNSATAAVTYVVNTPVDAGGTGGGGWTGGGDDGDAGHHHHDHHDRGRHRHRGWERSRHGHPPCTGAGEGHR
jgi:Tol biopolymer transport system component